MAATRDALASKEAQGNAAGIHDGIPDDAFKPVGKWNNPNEGNYGR